MHVIVLRTALARNAWFLANSKYTGMTKKQQAQFRYYKRKKHFDALGFRAITEYSSFRSNIYKWRDNMEGLLKSKNDLEVQLADALKLSLTNFLSFSIW